MIRWRVSLLTCEMVVVLGGGNGTVLLLLSARAEEAWLCWRVLG